MIWWCAKHNAPYRESTGCLMVEALLIVKENGDWPKWALTIVDYEANDMEGQEQRILDGLAAGIDVLPADLRDSL